MVVLIMATGLIQAYVYVRHLGDLLSTGYGRAVLAKFLLLLCGDGASPPTTAGGSMPRLEAIAERGGLARARPASSCAAPCAPRWRCSPW